MTLTQRLTQRLTRRRHLPGGDRSPWRFAVPVVCLLAGLLLATTHSVSAGREIRRSDSPRLVDLVRDSQAAVDRLATERDELNVRLETTHGGRPGPALGAMQNRIDELSAQAGLDPARGPGIVVTLTDAERDADGRFPRDAAPDDLVVHQQDIDAVLNALWTGGAEAIQLQDQRLAATSAPRCVGNTLLLNGRTYSPPYAITALGDAAAMQAELDRAPAIRLYKQYVVRFGLGYRAEAGADLTVTGYREPLRVRYAQPAGPLGY